MVPFMTLQVYNIVTIPYQYVIIQIVRKRLLTASVIVATFKIYKRQLFGIIEDIFSA